MLFRKKILVVGGRGFIGSHVVAALKNPEVIDLRDGNDFLKVEPYLVDTIIFLAVDMGRTEEAYEYNQRLYEQLDRWLARYPTTQVIYTSSAAVYPDVRKSQSELVIPAPVNLYGRAKLLGECHVQQYYRHTILRLSNVYGEGGKGAVDLFKEGSNTIFGTGKQVRDYVSVKIVVKAICAAIKYPRQWRGITNVSAGIGLDTRAVFRRYGSGRPVYAEARKGDVKYSVLDNHKLGGLLWNL